MLISYHYLLIHFFPFSFHTVYTTVLLFSTSSILIYQVCLLPASVLV